MSTKFDWDQFETVENSPSHGFDWNQFKTVPSKSRSVAAAAPKGLIKGVRDIVESNPLGSVGPIPLQLQEKLIEKVLPTREERTEKILERGGRLLPSVVAGGPGNLVAKGAQLALGTAAGQLAEEAGVGKLGQSLAELGGIGLPGLTQAAGRKVASIFKATPETLPSGITKPKVMDSKFAEKGIITPLRQEKSLKKLDEEASKLTKESLQKARPIYKRIEEGADIQGELNKRFEGLKKAADKSNPQVDITDMTDLLNKTIKKYKGIPELHPEAKKVMREVRALYNKPQTSLRNLLKIFRSNNQKRKSIYETSRLTGKQQEYVDFLGDVNSSIVNSFERTLPKDSEWLKSFKQLNAENTALRRTEETMKQLQSVLEQRATPTTLQRFSTDKAKQKKLALSMGQEGANEIIQIATDLKNAKEAIRRIPARDLKWYEAVFPLSFFVPGFKLFTAVPAAKKTLDFTRRGYGWVLTTPKRRQAYNDALKALEENNRPAYMKAAETLRGELEKEGGKLFSSEPKVDTTPNKSNE